MTHIPSAGTKVHYRWDLYHAWIQMLLPMGPLSRLCPNINIYDIYYAWVQMFLQMGPLSRLGPFITLVPSTKCLQFQ